MESYSIIQQYALIGLDGIDSKNKTVEKTAVLRAIATGRFVEKRMESGGHQEADFQEKLEQGIKEARALGTRGTKGSGKGDCRSFKSRWSFGGSAGSFGLRYVL